MSLQYWTIWYPKAAATGLLFARGLLDPTEVLLVHAPPPVLTVEVSDEQGTRLAFGRDLEAAADLPICLLRLTSSMIERQDMWPGEANYGQPVMLPGGEVGILQYWWTADDRKEWRWRIELYNSLR